VRIFFSHTSRDKPLVREVISQLPPQIQSWIEEKDLVIDDDLALSIRKAIETDSDLVVILLGKDVLKSPWVKRELRWALQREKQLGQTFVYPVLLDRDIWMSINPPAFRKRKYLECTDFSERGVKALAAALGQQLSAWHYRHVDETKNVPGDRRKIVVEALSFRAPDAIKAKSQAGRQLLIESIDIPDHPLGVRVRNEGHTSVRLIGFGIKAKQKGKRDARLPEIPGGEPAMLPSAFEPGSYHEFVTDLSRVATLLKGITRYKSPATIYGYYQSHDGDEFLSSPVTLDLDTLQVRFQK
jgi:hypothetical protein